MSNWRYWVVNGCIIGVVVLLSIIVYFYSKDNCPFGTMPCGSEDTCVPQRDVCNGHDDCPDGEDEDGIFCADLSGSALLADIEFNKSTRRKETEDQYDCVVREYPEMCICIYESRLYCSNGRFRDIPEGVSKEVTHLSLRNSSISILNKDSLAGFNLTLLQLEYTGLIYVDPRAFEDQQSLQKLFLMNNKLVSLEAPVFQSLGNLEWLHLDKNNLESIDMAVLEPLTALTWLNLSHNQLTFNLNESFPKLPKLLDLYLNDNQIRYIGNSTFSNLTNLSLLNLKSNSIRVIESGAFTNLQRLTELDLSNNRLRVLHPSLFVSQQALTKLSLGWNYISYFEPSLFVHTQGLRSLNLEDLYIENIDTELFSSLNNLQWIYFKSYIYCTYVPHVRRCRPLSNGISSVKQLLFKAIFRYSNWIMCLLTLGGNSLVLFGRFLFRDENKNLSIVIRNLAVSDGLMGIYLLIIGYNDLKFRDNYQEMARKWISSWNCVGTGIIGMTSLEVSVLILVYLSVDRYCAITMPYKKYKGLNCKDTKRVLLCIWCIGIGVSVLPAVVFVSSTKFYGVNGLCLPLYIDDPYLIGWQYSAIIFFGINATGLLIIIYTYVAMFVNIKNTRNATSLPTNDCQFAVRFFFIVLSNVTCWLPIIIAKMLVYFAIEIPNDIYGWLVVFVLPINSSLNPILYTFSTRKYRRRIVKMPDCIKKIALLNNSNGTNLNREAFKISQKDIKDEKQNGRA